MNLKALKRPTNTAIAPDRRSKDVVRIGIIGSGRIGGNAGMVDGDTVFFGNATPIAVLGYET